MNATRTFRRTAVFLLALIAAIPAFSSGRGDGEIADAATLKGEIIYMEGDVSLNGVPASIGASVSPGDRIVTGEGGIAEVTFGSKNILQFRSNTESQIHPDWAGVDITRGTLAAVLDGLAQLGFGTMKRFTVKTDTAVMAVRGTTFFVDRKNANETYLCTCNGKLHIESPEGEVTMDTEAYHHEGVWYVRSPDGVGALPAGLFYHDDGMMNKLAARAGTRVRWKTR